MITLNQYDMELTKKNIETGEKVILTRKGTKEGFFALMKKAIQKYGRKSEGISNGFTWPNAHKLVFTAGGYEFKLEFLSEFDFFDE